ncbi:hypothetical protein KXX16_009381 [Aspergillus fumigatus]|uniref:Conserved glutamic acid rich protein n=1 Tax=Aspergillus fumigatus (strain CBS 144.89 / FGSC A1163 / CEA10) TaxID=451804 RepID=B0Y453_ASPFC|nr:conserved glutamic acid rich protein [Aspergillus fumigatus A1163]KAF4280568.1 hypothetical protein CNMCM8689_001812 [Aspergillus fumigatus]KAH1293529.1 hypothetical protein KXX30_003930 [Aspergillus fumigatus]KAH1330317.1 hypothetical protein KXX38_000742 [Aspergillus fumigatus]KAH1368847.1 hypothetical protein KXX14_003530 [Aspergillus fumigatus]
MSRRGRNHDYYEEHFYEKESDTYRRPQRSRHKRFAQDDEYDELKHGSRMSPPLPVDELTRLHIQERSKPDFIHESFDPPRYPGPLAVMREREENEMDMLPPETLRGYELDRHERRERPRHRRTAKGEDVYFQEKSQRQRYTRAEYDEGEFELQRERPSIPRSNLDSDEELVRLRSDKKGKKGSRVKHADLEIERDELYRRGSDARWEHTRLHSDVRERTPAAHLRSHRHRQPDGDEEDAEDIIIQRDERRGRSGRFKEKEKITMREREISTSPESPSSRELSQVRKSHVTSRERMRDGYELPRAPLAPSPDPSSPSSFEELEIRHRTRGRPRKEKIIIERRDDTSPPSILSSSESGNKSEDELDITHANLKTSNRREDVLIMERQPQPHESDEEVHVFEEEQYTRHDAGGPQRRSTPTVTIEDKAIVRADSGSHGSADQQMRRERRVSTQRSRSIKGHRRLSDENIDCKDGRIGRRYIGVKDQRDRLWTEITKDLVVREAIERAGYEYEETDSFYYIFSYLGYDDISALVALSEDIRRARRQRIQEIRRERGSMRIPFAPEPVTPAPVLPGRPPSPRLRSRDERRLKKERELIIEEGRWRPGPAPLKRW